LEILRQDCGLTQAWIIADVGSGTGLLSRVFLENGNQVFGIEPNLEMRQAGERLMSGFKNFTSIEGTAEATTLPRQRVDLVVAGQAAHWFHRDRARREFARILRPPRWVVLMWNERKTDSTPFLREYENLLLKYGTDYQEVRHERTTEEIGGFFAPSPFRSSTLANHQDFDYPGMEGRLLSSSYTPQAGDGRFQPMLKELRRIFDRYQENGTVRLEYETRMYYGQAAIIIST
jgi:SAM-dependent methyltransferase